MVKRKNMGPTLDELLERPFCYYCERDFDSLRILMDHMKAKHLKCSRCNRRLNTAGGLRVHMDQVHKEKPDLIENALQSRADPTVEIFGMEGIPEDVLQEHNRRISEMWHKQEHDRRVATGNPPPGQTHESKRQKKEDPADVKARAKALIEQKKAEKAAKAAGGNNAEATPAIGTPEVQMPDASQAAQAPPQYPTQAGPWGSYGPAGFPPNAGHEQYGQPHYAGSPAGPAPFQPPNPYSPYSPAPPHAQYPGQGAPNYPPQHGYGPPPAYGGYNPSHTPNFGTPSQSPGQAAFANGRPHPQQRAHNTSMSPQSGQSTSPQTQAPPSQQQINNIPPPPGLPSRPAFPSPNLTKEEMAAMHSGGTGAPGAVQSIALNRYEKKKAESNRQMISDSVDELIESVTSGAANAKKANGIGQEHQQIDTIASPAPVADEAYANVSASAVTTGTEAFQPGNQVAPSSDAANTKDGKKKKESKKQKILVNESESIEELLAGQARYQTPA
ncbi:hypothetical protein MBLNU230_g3449t1 [Neophaeotheca triangularis]